MPLKSLPNHWRRLRISIDKVFDRANDPRQIQPACFVGITGAKPLLDHCDARIQQNRFRLQARKILPNCFDFIDLRKAAHNDRYAAYRFFTC